MTTDTTVLQERIAQALWEVELKVPCGQTPDCQKLAAAVLPIIAAEVRAATDGLLTKRWVCQVARSGYHNGASCRPDDAHNDWGCDYYYEASIRAAEYETGDQA